MSYGATADRHATQRRTVSTAEADVQARVTPPTESTALNTSSPTTCKTPGLPASVAAPSLSTLHIAILAFCFTCSGPGGLEAVVRAGGPFWAFVGVLGVPVIFCMPQILVVSELGAMMPTSAGTVSWVHQAFGDFAGFYNAWMTAATNMVDAASYPVLFGDYVIQSFRQDASHSERVAWRLIGLALTCSISLLSAKNVSTVSTAATVGIVGFVVIAFGVSSPHIRTAPWGEVAPNVDWALLNASLLWLYTGWGAVGSLAGETRHAAVLFRGMVMAMVAAVSTYLLSLIAALTVTGHAQSPKAMEREWADGFFVVAFDRILPGSHVVFGVLMVATMLTLAISGLVCYSRSLWGVAELGWAPQFLRWQLANGSPWTSVLAHGAAGMVLMAYDFSLIVRLEYTLAAVSSILVYFSFLRLRYVAPDVERPWKVPFGMPFAWLITLTKTCLMGFMLVSGLTDARIAVAFVVANVCVAVGYVAYRRVFVATFEHPLDSPLERLPHNAAVDAIAADAE